MDPSRSRWFSQAPRRGCRLGCRVVTRRPAVGLCARTRDIPRPLGWNTTAQADHDPRWLVFFAVLAGRKTIALLWDRPRHAQFQHLGGRPGRKRLASVAAAEFPSGPRRMFRPMECRLCLLL